jgi:tetratricopeptide (TPR) repeat protein
MGLRIVTIVHRAEDTELSRFVALKFPPCDLAHTGQTLERFHLEARVGLCRSLALATSLCFFLLLSSAGLRARGLPSNQAQAQDARAETHAEKGLQSAQEGNLQLAEDELRKAVALAPGSAEFLSNLGTVLAMEKKLEESTKFFERALKINAGDLGARRYLAANLWQLHRYVEAKRNLLIILKVQPGDPQATLLFGMVAENTGDYLTVVNMLSSVPTLVREHTESIAALARAYYHLGETEKARAWLMELQNHPAGVEAVFLGSQIADEMQDYSTAESLLISLRPAFSDQAAVSYKLAVVKFHSKQFEECRRILQQLLDAGQKTGEILRLLGWCYQGQNRYEEAVHALQDSTRLDPTGETNYLDLGKILLAQRRLPAALELSKRTVNAFPDSPRAFFLKGSVDLAVNQFTDAVQSFTRALQLDPAGLDATVGLARAQAGAGMTEQAKTTLQSAIRRFIEKAPLELELAQLLLKESETGKGNEEARAEQLLHSAVAHDNALAEAYYQLGNLALRHDRAAEALTHLERAAKLDPESAKTHFALSRAYRRLGRNEEAAKQTDLYDKLKEKESQRAPVPSLADPSSK